MNALELATELAAPIGTSGQSTYATCEQAATLLRRQHEAIVKLREALRFLHEREWQDDEGHYLLMQARDAAVKALKDTEGIAK